MSFQHQIKMLTYPLHGRNSILPAVVGNITLSQWPLVSALASAFCCCFHLSSQNWPRHNMQSFSCDNIYFFNMYF